MGAGYSIKARASQSAADIFVYEDVGALWDGGVTAKQFASDLAGLGKVDTLNVHISSLGGDVHEGLAIHRQLVEHPARVVSYVDGWAASIASVIAMAGEEIKISDAGAVMIHEAWGLAIGNASDLRSIADRMDATSGSIAKVYADRTGNEMDKIRAWMAAETWFYGQEAVDAGFATSVMDNVKVAARFDPTKHVFKNAPVDLSLMASTGPIRTNPIIRPAYDAAAARIAAHKAQMALRKNRELRAA